MSSKNDTVRAGNSRRDFFKNTAAMGLGLVAGATAAGAMTPDSAAKNDTGLFVTRPRKSGAKSVFNLHTKPLDEVRIGVIGLSRGQTHVRNSSLLDWVRITALCDIRKDRLDRSVQMAEHNNGDIKPALYFENDTAWEKMMERDDIDVVYIATPWDLHVPMALAAMRHGKHAFIEVAAAVTLEDCWALIDTAEQTQRHCAILENCCYGENELFVLNMVRNGVFETLTHAECAYIHDLRDMLFLLGTEGDWRREYHKILDANLYPTHGLGPVSLFMDILRGDNFKHLVSMSSPEAGLSKWLREKNPNNGKHAGEKYICGDMNTTLIKTELGRSIMVQHDVISPRPYSRINALSGTGATFFDFPPRLALDQPQKYGVQTHSHEWLLAGELQKMREKFTHPLITKLREISKGGGHGGMDFVMNYRLLDQLRNGTPLDLNVYDAALWSSLIDLTAHSAKHDSAPVPVPDFTRGEWKTNKAFI